MKKFISIVLLSIILPVCILFSGCAFSLNKPYIVSITKNPGTNSGYTITYSNGETSQLDIVDGRDGVDLTIQSIKEYCEANDLDFKTFLKTYFEVKYNNITVTDDKSPIYEAIQSCVSVWNNGGCGAGVIYKMDKSENGYSYILTNYHVVYSNTRGEYRTNYVFSYGTGEYYSSSLVGNGAVETTLIGKSKTYDIAVLKASTSDILKYNPYAKAVTLATSYHIADNAIAIGNPEGHGLSVTSGVISRETMSVNGSAADDSVQDFREIKFDTAVNPGNSGGGLFNANGELIGIVNAKIEDDAIDNIGYALPMDNVEKVADNLIYYYENYISTNPTSQNFVSTVKKLYLNITIQEKNQHPNYIDLCGDTVVVSVTRGGFANGILQVDDIINYVKIKHADGSVEEFNISLKYKLMECLLNVKAGDEVTFAGIRNNEQKTFGTKTVSASNLINVV